MVDGLLSPEEDDDDDCAAQNPRPNNFLALKDPGAGVLRIPATSGRPPDRIPFPIVLLPHQTYLSHLLRSYGAKTMTLRYQWQ
jgi:hypothetical protein